MSALSDCYARPSTPFGQLGPFYDALGHRGKDYSRGARQPIIAYDDMVIEATPAWSSGLGWTVGLRRLKLGGFAGYAHVYDLGGIGARIPKGGVIAYVAGWGDRPGSLWDGPHIHTTESFVSAFNAAIGVRPLSDPSVAIARAIRSAVAVGETVEIGDDMPSEEWLNGMGQSIKDDISAVVRSEAGKVRADLNYMHQLSPYSLKAIREAVAAGRPVDLSPAQVESLSKQLVSGVTAGLAVAFDEDQAAVLAAIRALPDQVRATLKAAL